MLVYEIGADVLIFDSTEGRVTAIMIEDGANVFYKVSYWNGSKLENDWMTSLMVTPKVGDKKQEIGFRSGAVGESNE